MIINSIKDLDLERLHDVIEGKLDYRGAGKTTAIIFQMLGAAQVSDNGAAFLYIGENHRMAVEVYKTVETLLHELGFKPHDNTFNICDQTQPQVKASNSSLTLRLCDRGRTSNLMFVEIQRDLICRVRGYSFDEIYVDVTLPTYYQHAEDLDEVFISRKL